MTTRARWLIGAALLGTGFVRQTTPSGTPIEWQDACPLLAVGQVAEGGPSAEQVRDVVQQAIDAWQSDGCNQLPLSVRVVSPTFDAAGFDGHNVVVTRAADYCRDPTHAGEDVCLSPLALAVTTTFYNDLPGDPADGELLEVDLEINLRHPFSAAGDPQAYDLLSVVTHELGHILGLEHSCVTERGARVIDPAGNLVPSCSTGTLDQRLVDATMYPWADPGEILRRTPESDERQAMCLVYRKHPRTCSPRGELVACGCSSKPGDDASVVLVVAGIVVMSCGRRRRGSLQARRPS